jgi:hypothetical protein
MYVIPVLVLWGASGALFLVQEKFPRRLIVLAANARRWTIINTLVPYHRPVNRRICRTPHDAKGRAVFLSRPARQARRPTSGGRRREFVVDVSDFQRHSPGAHRAMNTGI